MTFRNYLRWDGSILVLLGTAMFAFGVVEGHQGAPDALFSGLVMITGTGVFMTVRHRASFRAPSAWFTSKPLARAARDRAACTRRRLLLFLSIEMAALAALTVGLSFATGFWLTYVDVGVWAVAIGAIKIGPARSAIAAHEARTGASYRMAHRRFRDLALVEVQRQ